MKRKLLMCSLMAVGLLVGCGKDPKALAACQERLEKEPSFQADQVSNMRQTGLLSINGKRGISGTVTLTTRDGKERKARFECLLNNGVVEDLSVEYDH